MEDLAARIREAAIIGGLVLDDEAVGNVRYYADGCPNGCPTDCLQRCVTGCSSERK
jgi:hypothetical protein